MPICRIVGPTGQPEYAIYREDAVCPLRHLTDQPPFEAELFSFDWTSIGDPDAIPADRWSDQAQWLPPVPPPEKIICIGLNYRDHAIETGAEIPTEPVVFGKFSSALIGPGQAIELPAISKRVDYEAELVVVIGREAKNVTADRAMDFVFGYSCGHDVSARDWQKGRPGGQWLLGKTFDTFAPLGPCIATKSELPDPSNLRVRMELNGHTVQDSTTAQLIFDIPSLIAHLSQFVTLKPGDLIYTGTPPGVGDAKDPPVYLKPGDRCSVIIEGIGTLTNPCR
ncbi:fumarylacetoacetate hydrolase family protein [Roseiconus nitratireducens]|uniref:Fumarylacetoacetate hydrolase family protein n=1 Tax=Roseiconus nitratireducens TaxID=2605748 RepID=A0A5M6DLN9_9BACT|nr:fumarylacetoacetate hydrolase family protein [Roseiconus nitratireducens]KAA5547172.1 fumarylacetoacetate hydrolase family protein [Roseiconus nitratireducens]